MIRPWQEVGDDAQRLGGVGLSPDAKPMSHRIGDWLSGHYSTKGPDAHPLQSSDGITHTKPGAFAIDVTHRDGTVDSYRGREGVEAGAVGRVVRAAEGLRDSLNLRPSWYRD